VHRGIARQFLYWRAAASIIPQLRHTIATIGGDDLDMGKNIAAIVVIFLFTTCAWIILGTSVMARTGSADSGLSKDVQSNWGSAQQQSPPAAVSTHTAQKTVHENRNGVTITNSVDENVDTPLPIEQSRVRVALDLEQRQKGLLWFATYRVAFHGDYVFRNAPASDKVTVKLVFPAPDAIYDDLILRADGQPLPLTTENGTVSAVIHRPPGSAIHLEVGYRSQGLSTWDYKLGENVSQVRDFTMEMTTNFDAIDFPQGGLSPTMKKKTDHGWLLTWKYSNLVTGYRIGMVLPEKLQPGPLAGRISFFAPVSLLFFFFLMFIITTLRGIDLHPMHYFFLATSFFAFHLLLAYLADHISIHAAFAICSAVSIFLVVSYLRIVIGSRFAFVEASLAQFIYLVLFSYAFFFQGFTGLSITIGAIITLFVVMQMTARIDWGAPRTSSAS
jgi:inner membrane protein involved in colicin E2 resistance